MNEVDVPGRRVGLCELHGMVHKLTSEGTWTKEESFIQGRVTTFFSLMEDLRVIKASVEGHIQEHRPPKISIGGGHREYKYTPSGATAEEDI